MSFRVHSYMHSCNGQTISGYRDSTGKLKWGVEHKTEMFCRFCGDKFPLTEREAIVQAAVEINEKCSGEKFNDEVISALGGGKKRLRQ